MQVHLASYFASQSRMLGQAGTCWPPLAYITGLPVSDPPTVRMTLIGFN